MTNIATLEQLWISVLVFIAVLVLVVFFLKRLLAWMDERGWITYTGHVPTYGSLANAFLELQSLAQPEKQYVIRIKDEEKQKRDQTDAGGPDEAGPPAVRQ